MAVPRDGLTNEDVAGGIDNGDSDNEVPPHLRDLAAAAQDGDVDALRAALDNLNGNVNEPLEDGDTALHLACLYGNLPSVQLLLERGADIEVRDEEGAIPLHDACAGGYLEIVQLILHKASDAELVKRMLETVDTDGDTPLHHAARGEHVDVISLLLASGASPTCTNTYGKTPSELADSGTEAKRVLEAVTNALPGN